jgi:hypothetical protein
VESEESEERSSRNRGEDMEVEEQEGKRRGGRGRGKRADMRDEDRLALAHNQLTGFSDEFADLPRLRYLNLRSNFLREFPAAVSFHPPLLYLLWMKGGMVILQRRRRRS